MAAVERGRVRARGARAQAGPAVDHGVLVPRVSRHGSHDLRRRGRSSRSIQDAFVPVRVDTDRRPDINDRYNLGRMADDRVSDGGRRPAGRRNVRDRRSHAGILQRVLEAVRTRGDEIERAQAATDTSRVVARG